jgi:hypothetical protein
MKRVTRRTRIRWLPAALVLAALLLALLPATLEGAFAGEPSTALDDELAQAHARLPAREWTAIRNVIDAQREALRAGDAARAFSFAAPGIQERFHDAATFAAMVQQAYAPLLDARSAEFLEGGVVEDKTLQPLRLVMNDGTVLVAIYEMRKDDAGRWRIAACVIAPSTVRSV